MRNLQPWPNVRLYPYRDSARRECFEVWVGPEADAEKRGDVRTDKREGFWYTFNLENEFGFCKTLREAIEALLEGPTRIEVY